MLALLFLLDYFIIMSKPKYVAFVMSSSIVIFVR